MCSHKKVLTKVKKVAATMYGRLGAQTLLLFTARPHVLHNRPE